MSYKPTSYNNLYSPKVNINKPHARDIIDKITADNIPLGMVTIKEPETNREIENTTQLKKARNRPLQAPNKGANTLTCGLTLALPEIKSPTRLLHLRTY